MEMVYEILVNMPGRNRDRLVPLKKRFSNYSDAKLSALKYFLTLDVTDVVFSYVHDTHDGGCYADIFVIIYDSAYTNDGEYIEKIKVGTIRGCEVNVNDKTDIALD